MKLFFLLLALLFVGIFAGCTLASDPTNTPTISENSTVSSGTLAFKEEYESLNDGERPYMEVPTNISVHTLDFAATKDMLENRTGILYFGFPTCPWCRNLLPELFVAMDKQGIKDLYYYNPREIRNTLSRDEDGNVIEETPTNDEYAYLLEKLDSVLPVYTDVDTDGTIKRLYVPFVVVLQNGEIVAHHLSTIDEQEDPNIPLTDAQKIQLQDILSEKIAPISGETSLFAEPCPIEPEVGC